MLFAVFLSLFADADQPATPIAPPGQPDSWIGVVAYVAGGAFMCLQLAMSWWTSKERQKLKGERARAQKREKRLMQIVIRLRGNVSDLKGKHDECTTKTNDLETRVTNLQTKSEVDVEEQKRKIAELEKTHATEMSKQKALWDLDRKHKHHANNVIQVLVGKLHEAGIQFDPPEFKPEMMTLASRENG